MVKLARTQFFFKGLGFLLGLALPLLHGTSILGQQHSATESQVKAAFVYHFTRFIKWPSSSFPSENSPFTLCVFGNNSFAPILEKTMNGKSVGQHPFVILQSPSPKNLHLCHVAYLGKSYSEPLPTLHNSGLGPDVLTVGETKEFLIQGGMIQFYLENKKIRFAINRNAINNTHLQISAKLLQLGKMVSL